MTSTTWKAWLNRGYLAVTQSEFLRARRILEETLLSRTVSATATVGRSSSRTSAPRSSAWVSRGSPPGATARA